MSEPNFAEPTLEDFGDPVYREAVEIHRFYDGVVERLACIPSSVWEVWNGTPDSFDWWMYRYRIVGTLRTPKNKTGEPDVPPARPTVNGQPVDDVKININSNANEIIGTIDERIAEELKQRVQPGDTDPAASGRLRDEQELIWTASAGARGPDQQRIADEVIRWGALLLRKNADYGSSAWKTPVLQPHCDVGTAILVRMSDKIERIQSLLKNGGANVNDESLEDTIRDLGCYALLYLARPTDDEPIDMDTL